MYSSGMSKLTTAKIYMDVLMVAFQVGWCIYLVGKSWAGGLPSFTWKMLVELLCVLKLFWQDAFPEATCVSRYFRV